MVRSIEKIGAAAPLPSAGGSPVLAILRELNIPALVVDVYKQTLAYRTEAMRLECEMERVRLQADVLHRQIASDFAARMREIESRQAALDHAYAATTAVIADMKVSREALLAMAQASQQQMLSPGIGMDERVLYKDMTVALLQQLQAMGSSSHATVRDFVRNASGMASSFTAIEG